MQQESLASRPPPDPATTQRPDAPPRTLFDLAGAPPHPSRPSDPDAVLLIIDAQREYVDGALPLHGVQEAIATIARLLAQARTAGTPVIHVVHKGQGALFNPASPGFEIVALLQPLAGETIIEKSKVSAFAGTGLAEALQRIGRRQLVVAGFMTHHCVSTTARAARDLGYTPTIVATATATRDLPDGQRGVIPAAVVQRASLAALADRTAVIAAA